MGLLWFAGGKRSDRGADSAAMVALSKSQAIITFDLEGVILDANENFLAVMGYRLDEVAGQHHRMFVEPSYAQSGDYRSFWERLRGGTFDRAEYKRLGKGGKEVWIQASYTNSP